MYQTVNVGKYTIQESYRFVNTRKYCNYCFSLNVDSSVILGSCQNTGSQFLHEGLVQMIFRSLKMGDFYVQKPLIFQGEIFMD